MTYISNIHDVVYLIAVFLQGPFENILGDIRSQIPDMRKVIHRRPAGVETHPWRCDGDKYFFFLCERVIEGERHNQVLNPKSPACAGRQFLMTKQIPMLKISKYLGIGA